MFKEYYALINGKLGKVFKILRFDLSGEYLLGELANFCGTL